MNRPTYLDEESATRLRSMQATNYTPALYGLVIYQPKSSPTCLFINWGCDVVRFVRAFFPCDRLSMFGSEPAPNLHGGATLESGCLLRECPCRRPQSDKRTCLS